MAISPSIPSLLYKKSSLKEINLRFSLISLLSLLFTCCTPANTDTPGAPVIVPSPKATAINQIPINKNGCGPVALMNAYRFASPEWHIGYDKLAHDVNATENEKFTYLVRKFGIRVSKHDGLMRWDKRIGMNALDLADMANDYQTSRKTELPKLKVSSHHQSVGIANDTLLKKVHKHLRDSLKEGFPPIITVKRFAQKRLGAHRIWRQVHGHFVIIHEIPENLEPEATSFDIKYIDPWGGRIIPGTVKIPEQNYKAYDSTDKKVKWKVTPALAVDFPHSNLGKDLLKKGEFSSVILSSSITP